MKPSITFQTSRKNILLFVVLGFLMMRHYFAAIPYGNIIYWSIAFLSVLALGVISMKEIFANLESGNTKAVKKRLTFIFVNFMLVLAVGIGTYIYLQP